MLAMALASPAWAVDGDLDPSFSTNGYDVQHFDGSDLGADVAVQPDGRVVSVGTSAVPGDEDFAVMRHMPDGTLDGSFNGTGMAEFGFGGNSDDRADAVAVQPDGKIVVAGWTNRLANNTGNSDQNFAVIRLNANGTLDASFNDVLIPTLANGDGRANLDLSSQDGNDQAHDVLIQPDGKILVAGGALTGATADFGVVRLTPEGTRDSGFGANGEAEETTFGGEDIVEAVALQDDGKIVAVGYTNVNASNDFAAARFNSNGTRDGTFSPGGADEAEDIQDFTGDDRAQGVVIQPDGKIVLAGTWDEGATSDFALLRYNASDGTLDATFNDVPNPPPPWSGDGKLSFDFESSSVDFGMDVTLTGDGRKLLVAGFTDAGDGVDLGLARVDFDGSLDGTFGGVDGDTPGTRAVEIFGNQSFSGAALQDDGRVVAAGNTDLADPGLPAQNVIVARVDSVAAPAASPSDPGVGEGVPAATFTVTLDKPSAKTVRVDFATADGSATAGADYTAASGTLTFAPEETSKTVDVGILNDGADEPDESFALNLTGSENASVADAQGAGTIVDDDPAAQLDPFPGNPSFVGSIALNPRVLRAANSGSSATEAGTQIATTVTYRLSEPATVTWRVRRARPGRRVRGRCVKPRRTNRARRKCRRYVRVRGSFTTAGAQGVNRFRFTGRLRNRKLRPGRYRLVAVATDSTGLKSAPKRAGFRIVRR
jgi:uncharacterized delta-60 repeat protein